MAAASLLQTALKWKPIPPTHLRPRRLLPPPNLNSLLWTQKPKGLAKLEAMSSPPSSNSSFVKKRESFRKKKKPAIANAADLSLAYSGGRMSGDLLNSATPPEKSPRTETPRFGFLRSVVVAGVRDLAIFWSIVMLASILGPEFGAGVPLLCWIFLWPFVVACSVFRLILMWPILIVLSLLRSLWPSSKETVVTSIVKLQVGLLGMGGSVQQDLNRIAEKADTSTAEGLSYTLKETMLALLRNSGYHVSVCSSFDVKYKLKDVEERFDQLSIEERGKFKETLVNVNNVKGQSATTRGDDGLRNEYIVVTILVAIKGGHELPVIKGSKDLKESLQKLAIIASARIRALEVLWAPQEENDTMTERELLEDFPLLRPLQGNSSPFVYTSI